MLGLWEAVIIIVFLGADGFDIPPSRVEGPIVLAGFPSKEVCDSHRETGKSVWIARESEEHQVPEDEIEILSVCRLAGRPA